MYTNDGRHLPKQYTIDSLQKMTDAIFKRHRKSSIVGICNVLDTLGRVFLLSRRRNGIRDYSVPWNLFLKKQYFKILH